MRDRTHSGFYDFANAQRRWSKFLLARCVDVAGHGVWAVCKYVDFFCDEDQENQLSAEDGFSPRQADVKPVIQRLHPLLKLSSWFWSTDIGECFKWP